jgi:hypothetical protein
MIQEPSSDSNGWLSVMVVSIAEGGK